MQFLRPPIYALLCVGIIGHAYLQAEAAKVIVKGENIFIVDLHGEQWEVTQAVSLGFDPRAFQYGIGRNAFTPLDDTLLGAPDNSLSPHERILGITDGEHANAYSVGKLAYHEIANSAIGRAPIAAAYWPLVNLTAVYSREIDGKALNLSPSGWTYNYTFVLYDKETGTLWYPGEKGLFGIQGVYFKRWLPELDSDDTRWGEWVGKHPQTKLMK